MTVENWFGYLRLWSTRHVPLHRKHPLRALSPSRGCVSGLSVNCGDRPTQKERNNPPPHRLGEGAGHHRTRMN